jgi:zinc transporter ZupT
LTTVAYVALLAFAVTLLSGLLALHFRSHKAIVFAFCSGALIGGAVIFLLPDARELFAKSGSSLPPALLWLVCALGFLSFYLFELGSHAAGSARLAGIGGAIGVATHSFMDGVVIGQGFQVGDETGLVLAVAVMLHKLADGVSAVGVMLGTEHSVSQTTVMLLVTAIAPVAGVLAQSFVVLPTSLLALLLSMFAGMFLYLGANRLIPEARSASSSPWIPVLSLAGVAFVFLAHLLSH